MVWVGEGAVGKQGYALLNQLKYRLLTSYQLLLIHRYYSHDYCSFFSHSFGESGTPQNENGWYLAAEATPLEHWKFFASLDLFSFPWWKYRISKPSQGMDGMFQATYSPRRNLSVYFNYRYRQKERDVPETGGKVTLPVYHHKFRCRLTYMPKGFLCRTTVDYNHFRQQDGKGMNSRENKVGSVASLVLIHFLDFLWLYLCKALTFIRTITTPGFTLLKKACFIHFTPLLFMAEGFVILLMYVMT